MAESDLDMGANLGSSKFNKTQRSHIFFSPHLFCRWSNLTRTVIISCGCCVYDCWPECQAESRNKKDRVAPIVLACLSTSILFLYISTMIHCPNTILLLALSAYRMMPTTEAVSDKARHSVDVSKQELNVKAIETYNTNFMALMESPCRPEFDGYFGSTSGEPLEVQYGFKLETPPLSSIMDLLDVVEDRIVDSILVHSFPSQCGYRRRLQQQSRELSSAASGFRFMKFQEVGKDTICRKELL